MSPHVLVVDDDAAMAETIADGLVAAGFDAHALSQPEEARARIARGEHDALVTDLRMARHDGLELLALSHEVSPEAPVIVMTAFSAIDSAVESIRRGAYHYLAKPFKLDELTIFLRRALDEVARRRESRTLKQALRTSFAAAQLVGDSAAMRGVADLIERVAHADVPVLILGETGTGKSLVARALHAESPRAERALVSINCAAIPEALLESELFGHQRGAFTGAVSARAGLFEEAQGGTIFLDEIGEMPPALQAKLLHVLETGMIRRLGEARERAVNARVVAATNRDLRAAVRDGSFREDLLYRLDVVSIEIPALRFRRDDIPALVARFLEAARRKHAASPVERFAAEAMEALARYDWPGNVRELEHVVERAVLLGRSAEVARAELPRAVLEGQARAAAAPSFGGEVLPMRELQRRYAHWAFERCGGSKRAACDALQIDYKTLMRWLGSGDPG